MNQIGWLVGLALIVGLSAGCVQRRMTIVSEPPGAMVIVNNQELGAAPVDVPSHMYLYNGDYDFKLVKDGYEPLYVKQEAPPHWYQLPGIDFISENVVPWQIKDHRVFTYQLLPTKVVTSEELLQNADSLRGRGQAIGSTPPAQPPTGR